MHALHICRQAADACLQRRCLLPLASKKHNLLTDRILFTNGVISVISWRQTSWKQSETTSSKWPPRTSSTSRTPARTASRPFRLSASAAGSFPRRLPQTWCSRPSRSATGTSTAPATTGMRKRLILRSRTICLNTSLLERLCALGGTAKVLHLFCSWVSLHWSRKAVETGESFFTFHETGAGQGGWAAWAHRHVEVNRVQNWGTPALFEMITWL